MDRKAEFFDFVSHKFEPNKKRILFNYKIGFQSSQNSQLFFTETLVLPKTPKIDDSKKEVINKLLEGLHIMLGISYYKLYCPKKIKLNYRLSKKEADFWNIVYKKGLGEFFYKNSLDPKISPKFPYVKKIRHNIVTLQHYNRSLLGIGGGKDSIAAAELLKKGKFDIIGFVVETGKKSNLIERVVKTIGIKQIKINRYLDRQVYQKHQYDGHIPISAIYAFLGIFSAALYNYSYFIVGNEYSSNFGSLKYRGETVNHQWSKSFEFEKIFQNYISNFITPSLFYFSLLRPFYEIRIAKIFSKLSKYFSVFSSCNRNFGISDQKPILKPTWPASNAKLSFTGWCNKCPKCVFVFTLLSAFLSKRDLFKIFHKNLYQDESLLILFKSILGFGPIKPFDCVGTFEESQTALFLAKNKFKGDFIVRQLGPRVKYHAEVFGSNKDNLVPDNFKFLGMEKVLILGYGKEGQVTEKYIRRYYPKIKISIADANRGGNYLKKVFNYDIVIKTPGIPKEKLFIKIRSPKKLGARPSAKKFSALAPGIRKELLTIPYTTASNIFFSKVIRKNKIIGVTGSKGKSTTATLIYSILKMAGKKTELLGNIGRPMLESLLDKKIAAKTGIYFVVELSSYQLDDLKFSPDIAVVTNLFPEHMDYHGGVKNYYQAKKNIINFQNQDGYLVCNPKNKIIKSWLNVYNGRVVEFCQDSPKSQLIGEHNKNNIRAAISVAKILNIKNNVIKKAIENFKGLPHRLELVGQFKGIKFYDDAISTAPESTIMAIKSLSSVDTILLGGEDRGYNFSQLEKIIKKYKIKNVVLFPESGRKMIKSKNEFNVLETKSMKEAVKFAYKNTARGKICLLSCASPSYSLWKNFEAKGDEFKYYVRKLSN